MGHPQNIESLETSIETGNLQSYDEQSIYKSFHGFWQGFVTIGPHENYFNLCWQYTDK